MIVKEKDAFDYFCPQMIANGLDRSFNSCKGQACMAWRWAVEDNPDYKPYGNALVPQDLTKMYRRSTTHGYCGLAGGA